MIENKKNIFTIVLILFLLLLGGASIYLAIRVSTSKPVAPTAPVSKPQAGATAVECGACGDNSADKATCPTGMTCDTSFNPPGGYDLPGVCVKKDASGKITSGCNWTNSSTCSKINFSIACKPRPSCLDETTPCEVASTKYWCPYYSCESGKVAYVGDSSTPAALGDTVYPEQSVRYLIPLSNKAESDIASATITDTLDPRVSFIESSSPNCKFNEANRTVSCDIGKIQRTGDGQVTQVSYVVKVLKTATLGDLLNKAAIVTDKGSNSTCNNKLVIKAVPKPILSCLSKKSFDGSNVATTTFTKGQQVTYSFLLDNRGNAKSTGYKINDVLDAEGRDLLSFVSGEGCSYTSENKTVSCAAELNPEEKKTISFVAKISDSAGDNKNIKNVGVLSGPAVEGSIGISQCATSAAVRNPVINAKKRVFKDNTNNMAGKYVLAEEIDKVSRNQVFVYTISVTNSGTGKANGLKITDKLDTEGQENLRYVDGSAGCNYDDGSKTVTCVTDINGNSTKDISFRVKVNNTVENGITIKNTADVVLGDQTITVTKTVSISSIVGCDQTCKLDSQCSTGLYCDLSENKCRKKLCTAETSCVCPAVAVATPTESLTPEITATPTVALSPTEAISPTIEATVTASQTPTASLTPSATVTEMVIAEKTPVATKAPAELPSTGILDVPGIAVFGGGLMIAFIGILLAL